MRHALAFVVLALSATGIAAAQSAPQPKRLEGVQYYKVEYHRFKPGKADEGRASIRKHFDRQTGPQEWRFWSSPDHRGLGLDRILPVEPDFGYVQVMYKK